jgi:lysozyme
VIRRVLTAFALGLGAFMVYRLTYGKSYTTADGEGAGFDAVAGGFLDVAAQAGSLLGGNGMQISLAGLAAIKGHEGFRSTVYLDSAGKPTIGYGHLIKPYESFTSITEQEASRLLAQDVAAAEDTVNRLVKVPLSQNEYDALVSFVFNIGGGAFSRSTLLAQLNAGNKLAAQQQFTRWVYVTVGGQKQVVTGLANRRLAESRLFAGISVA